MAGKTAERARLFFEHRETGLHTGDFYFVNCPTCNSEIPFTKKLKKLIKNKLKEVG